MIKVYTHWEQGQNWIHRHQGKKPLFACILGFTATGLIEGISAAGAQPEDRQYTAIADAEFLLNGVVPNPTYPLPPLTAGASPVLISHAIVKALNFPICLFNAGLPIPPTVTAIDLGGQSAQCLTSGQALPLATVQHLFNQGLEWGHKLANQAGDGYLILSECVVGGTTTALAILTGLGIEAVGMVNSSHSQCNHTQKWEVVRTGLINGGWLPEQFDHHFTRLKLLKQPNLVDPLELVAAVGDPMQIVVAGMAITASRYSGVVLAGGTQMLAVYALIKAIAIYHNLDLNLEQVVVGTTRWVAEDLTGDTVGLAQKIGMVSLMATQLSFAVSRYPQLRAYEQGFVKEGVGAGGCAIAAYLNSGWQTAKLVGEIEVLFELCCQSQNQFNSPSRYR